MIVLQKQMLMGLNGQFYIGGMFRGENKTQGDKKSELLIESQYNQGLNIYFLTNNFFVSNI